MQIQENKLNIYAINNKHKTYQSLDSASKLARKK